MSSGRIRIDCYPGRDTAATIRIERPVHTARVFTGMTPEEVLAATQRLFHVCGTAQAAAAHHALAVARDQDPGQPIVTAHDVLVRLEIAREHLWRVLIDWTRFAALPSPSAALALLRELLPQATSALFDGHPFGGDVRLDVDRAGIESVLDRLDAVLEAHVLGLPPARWLALQTVEDLDRHTKPGDGIAGALIAHLRSRRWQASGAAEPHYLPTLPPHELAGILDHAGADGFVERPEWRGNACETSPLAREQGSPLVADVLTAFGAGLYARAVAAVRELAATTRHVRQLLEGSVLPTLSAESTGPGGAVAQVEAARGRLVHRVRLHAGHVADYRIVAPTEWNFHPRGAASRGLAAATETAGVDLEDQAALFVTLLDPCVGYALEVH